MGKKRRNNKNEAPLWLGYLFMGAGLYIVGISTGVIPAEESSFKAPRWVVLVVGAAFVFGGAAVTGREGSFFNDLMGSLIVFCLGVAVGWVSFFGSADGFSGGIPLLPDEINLGLARVLFGLGAIVCLVIAGYGMKRALGKL